MKPNDLRSYKEYSQNNIGGFHFRSRMKQLGYHSDEYQKKPLIAIINTSNDLMPCHSHFNQRVNEVKRGILQSGGFPIEMPVMGLSETFQKPTTMLYRNLLAMEVEEVLRSYPFDGCVLLGGCDKTTPALLMAAITVNLPSIFLPAGPMLKGHWRNKDIGSGTSVGYYWEELQAEKINNQDWKEIEENIARSPGHCMTMGTASTMTAIAETLGLCLSGSSSIPAVDSRHAQMAAQTGMRIVQMVWEDLKPKDILTPKSFINGITVIMAMGGSTNALIHLTAIAHRANINLHLGAFNTISKKIPVLANIKPTGKYLMEDFYYAGGLPALIKQLGELFDGEQNTVQNLSIKELTAESQIHNNDVIRSLQNPISKVAISILRGNLCPQGAVIKPGAMEPKLLKHTGPAVVFKNNVDLYNRINDPNLIIDENSVLVLQNAGPIGGPGMPEWGQLPIPKKLLKQGIRDMVRISDGRMSGTGYGACVLHVTPESAVGGPLALISNGDLIVLDVLEGTLNVLLDEKELEKRRKEWIPPEPKFVKGYGKIFLKHIQPATQGCDFDFIYE